MDRMKTFGIYALCVILFFIFSNVMINIAIKASCAPIDTYTTLREGIDIGINEAKATYVNGYVGGTIKNTGSAINKAYIKIDLYSKRDVILGTKYVEINYLQSQETQEFRMGFRFTDVEYAKIELVDEVGENATPDSFVSDNLGGIALLTVVAFLIFFG